MIAKKITNILFWSVLSAAFIGPGTITTAASAGTGFGFDLLWALLFSTIACVVLQEGSARLTIVSGKNLGQSIRSRYGNSKAGKILINLVLLTILLGCAAYEAGNILGAIVGAALVFPVSIPFLTLLIGSIAALLLWFGSTRLIAQSLGIIVAVMGFCFVSTAIIIKPAVPNLLRGMFIPHFPSGSELLIIGLVGTTVVPYNLFLGSGLIHSQKLGEMRFSLSMAIVLGGFISMAVLVVGTSITGNFSFEALAGTLQSGLGSWASTFLGIGLFSAGLSSAVTAPMAASLTARSLLADQPGSTAWGEKGIGFRIVWTIVLLTGVVFGVLQVQPVPIIILAQALNGIILPLISVILLLLVNDRELLSPQTLNSRTYNILMAFIVFITLLIGCTNIAKALMKVFGKAVLDENYILVASGVISALMVWPVLKTVGKYRKS